MAVGCGVTAATVVVGSATVIVGGGVYLVACVGVAVGKGLSAVAAGDTVGVLKDLWLQALANGVKIAEPPTSVAYLQNSRLFI